MLRCYSALGELSQKDSIHILSFKTVAFDDPELDDAQRLQDLVGPVYRFEGFNDVVRGRPNVRGPRMLDNNRKARYTVQVSWIVFVGSGRYALRRWKLGDGSEQRSRWFREDV